VHGSYAKWQVVQPGTIFNQEVSLNGHKNWIFLMWDSILLLDQTLYLIKYLKDVNTGLMNCADNCHTQYELVVLCTISTTIAVA
jgi:hypothetical protein